MYLELTKGLDESPKEDWPCIDTFKPENTRERMGRQNGKTQVPSPLSRGLAVKS